jgi:cytochrome c-type biogenesis protein CcmH
VHEAAVWSENRSDLAKEISMTLWPILTITTSAATVFLAAPFLRRLDQPKEIQAADRIRAPSLARFSPDKRDFLAVAIGGVIMLGSVGLYALNGSGDLPSASVKISSLGQPGFSAVDALAAATLAPGADHLLQKSPQAGIGNVDEMIARLVERLDRSPNDPEGWRMLGWSYFNTDRFAQSATAYAKAIELDPENADFRSSRGEALVRAADGLVTDAARAVFEQVLGLDAKDPRARFFIGLAKEQTGNKLAALDDWVAILNETDSGDAWVSDLVQRVTELGQETGVDVSARLRRRERAGHGDLLGMLQQQEQRPPITVPNKGDPGAEDVREAEAMKPADRMAMIQAMLDRLASRLDQSPRDIEGWIKLMRSRQLLGQAEAAEQTLRLALEAFKDTPQEQERIYSAARELELMK